ncbi:type II secretion system minor pseudopilin GspK [Desulfobacterium sp. N47]|uniref:type II secretion system minor pseudopilin GspK n=1 Tax=Desulfobacterium sp. N47 TaxID=3115210 RepID=UPI003F4A7E55
MSYSNSSMDSNKGMALILTIMILAIMTAMVVEFVHDVYSTNASLNNWIVSRQLSLAAKSGITIAKKQISDKQLLNTYTYPGKYEIPLGNIFSEAAGRAGGNVLVRVEDENAKFNLNSIVWPNGTTNDVAIELFKRLLKNIGLEEQIAYRIADWIDSDSESRVAGSETGAKNAYMYSMDELRLLPGMDLKTYESLRPFITVYGVDGLTSDLVNINSASIPVIMALNADISERLAERIIKYRDIEPLERASDLVKIAGFEGSLGQSLMGKIVVKAVNLRITSTAENDKIKRIIECVVENNGRMFVTRYWCER